MEQLSLGLTFGVEDSPAKTFRSQEVGLELGLKESELVSFMNSLALLVERFPLLSSSKTCRVSYLPTEEEISESFSKRWPHSGMLWDGVCLTANISESPNHVIDSSLLDIIETQSVPDRYFLSPNAARGILRRAASQGRALFPPLKKALEILAQDQSSNE
jgi:hypothetical protein